MAEQHGRTHLLVLAALWALVLLTAGAPLLWFLFTILSDPATLVEAIPDRFRLLLLTKTLLLSLASALLAVFLALPAVLALGRGRSRLARLLWFAVPLPLLLPSLVMGYGWTQFFWLLDAVPQAGSALDHARCIVALSAWLFPIVAVIGGLALRRLEPALQEQARLDGAGLRVTLRLLAPALVASGAVVMLIASQEFAVWEPTGISVVATELRMVFDTGAFSSSVNPIVAPLSDGSMPASADQASRAAAAVSVALPMLLLAALLMLPAVRLLRRDIGDDAPVVGRWPVPLDATLGTVVLAWLVLLVCIATPVVSMVLSLREPPRPWVILMEYAPQVRGSLLLSVASMGVALALSMLSATVRTRAAVAVGIVAFLVGGQLLAVALVRIYNRRLLGMDDWLYDSPASAVLAYTARFGWIALASGLATHGGGWRSLREQAAIDGAGPLRTMWSVVLPIAWPSLLASGLVIAALALTEVPATVLLAPQTLVPLLMTWVHMLRFEPMIEASLLMVTLVLLLSLAAAALARLALLKRPMFSVGAIGLLCAATLLAGCSERDRPESIWGQSGRGPGEFVYPRAIAYDGDGFFVVDRAGRVQRLDSTGRFITGWQMPKFERGKPVGLTVGPDGNLWVPDTHYNRVIVFDPSGKVVREFGSFGEGPGQFILPTDIAFDRDGLVYVAEYGGNDRVQVFDQQGRFVRAFGRIGRGLDELARPQSILVRDDELFIADSCNHRISVWSLDGRHLRNLGRVGSAPGEFRFPYGLDLDREGKLVVCEFGNNRVQRIDPRDGTPLGVWGRPGRAPGELVTPWAVAVDNAGRIVTVDGGNNRLQVFRF
jgi:ABC-type Fe3+ transport system permease subunit/DNA-binding beta-propeller fold protein YncE